VHFSTLSVQYARLYMPGILGLQEENRFGDFGVMDRSFFKIFNVPCIHDTWKANGSL